jgi:hypothetical protein
LAGGRAPASHGITIGGKVVELAGYRNRADPVKLVTGPIAGGWDGWERV